MTTPATIEAAGWTTMKTCLNTAAVLSTYAWLQSSQWMDWGSWADSNQNTHKGYMFTPHKTQCPTPQWLPPLQPTCEWLLWALQPHTKYAHPAIPILLNHTLPYVLLLKSTFAALLGMHFMSDHPSHTPSKPPFPTQSQHFIPNSMRCCGSQERLYREGQCKDGDPTPFERQYLVLFVDICWLHSFTSYCWI